MTTAQFLGLLADLGLGAMAYRIAKPLSLLVAKHDVKIEQHDQRIGVLERKG